MISNIRQDTFRVNTAAGRSHWRDQARRTSMFALHAAHFEMFWFQLMIILFQCKLWAVMTNDHIIVFTIRRHDLSHPIHPPTACARITDVLFSRSFSRFDLWTEDNGGALFFEAAPNHSAFLLSVAVVPQTGYNFRQ